MEEKLKELKNKWLSLCNEYVETYPKGRDGSISCDILLDEMRAIETTFRSLGTTVQEYKV